MEITNYLVEYKDFIVEVYPSTPHKDDEIFTEDTFNPTMVSPDEMRAGIEETAAKIRAEFEKEIEAVKEKYCGKMHSYEKYHEILKEHRYIFNCVKDVGMPDYGLTGNKLDSMYNVLEFLRKVDSEIKQMKLNENRIYLEPRMEYSVCVYGGDDADVDSIFIDFECKEIKMPDEKKIRRMAANDYLYNNVFPVFRYDCEAVEDYINGDLTWKGFVKKINPFLERRC